MGRRARGEPFPQIRAAMFPRWNILMVSHPRIPPHSLRFFPIFRKKQFKASFAIITWLMPGALPEPVCKTGGHKSPPCCVYGPLPDRSSVAR